MLASVQAAFYTNGNDNIRYLSWLQFMESNSIFVGSANYPTSATTTSSGDSSAMPLPEQSPSLSSRRSQYVSNNSHADGWNRIHEKPASRPMRYEVEWMSRADFGYVGREIRCTRGCLRGRDDCVWTWWIGCSRVRPGVTTLRCLSSYRMTCAKHLYLVYFPKIVIYSLKRIKQY